MRLDGYIAGGCYAGPAGRRLGADVVIDYTKEDFEKVLSGYEVVVNSLGKDTLEKSLTVLKAGGKLISISGPPDVAFDKENRSNWFLQQGMRLLSFGIRKKASTTASATRLFSCERTASS